MAIVNERHVIAMVATAENKWRVLLSNGHEIETDGILGVDGKWRVVDVTGARQLTDGEIPSVVNNGQGAEAEWPTTGATSSGPGEPLQGTPGTAAIPVTGEVIPTTEVPNE